METANNTMEKKDKVMCVCKLPLLSYLVSTLPLPPSAHADDFFLLPPRTIKAREFASAAAATQNAVAFMRSREREISIRIMLYKRYLPVSRFQYLHKKPKLQLIKM